MKSGKNGAYLLLENSFPMDQKSMISYPVVVKVEDEVPVEALLTPGQYRWWVGWSSTEVGRYAVDRLGLVVEKSEEVRRGEAISDRVEMWIGQVVLSPVVARRVDRALKPWETMDLSEYKRLGTCPF